MVASLTQIRNDRLNAERQIDEQRRSKRLSLATLTKGTLETGINFSATEDEVDADSMDYGGTAQGPPSPAESDRDSDDTAMRGIPALKGSLRNRRENWTGHYNWKCVTFFFSTPAIFITYFGLRSIPS